MKKMKKFLSVLLTLMMVIGASGCTSKTETEEKTETEKTVEVEVYKGSYLDLFDDDTRSNIISTMTEGVDDQTIKLVGAELPTYTFTDYDQETVEIKKGKMAVVEVVGSWCQYCQKISSEFMDQIVEDEDDVEFYQYFYKGTREDVNSFYATIDKDIPENITMLLSNDEMQNWLEANEITSVPFFIVIDTSGNIGLSWIGYVETPDFYEGLIELSRQNLGDKTAKGRDITIHDFVKQQEKVSEYIDSLETIEIPESFMK